MASNSQFHFGVSALAMAFGSGSSEKITASIRMLQYYIKNAYELMQTYILQRCMIYSYCECSNACHKKKVCCVRKVKWFDCYCSWQKRWTNLCIVHMWGRSLCGGYILYFQISCGLYDMMDPIPNILYVPHTALLLLRETRHKSRDHCVSRTHNRDNKCMKKHTSWWRLMNNIHFNIFTYNMRNGILVGDYFFLSLSLWSTLYKSSRIGNLTLMHFIAHARLFVCVECTTIWTNTHTYRCAEQIECSGFVCVCMCVATMANGTY